MGTDWGNKGTRIKKLKKQCKSMPFSNIRVTFFDPNRFSPTSGILWKSTYYGLFSLVFSPAVGQYRAASPPKNGLELGKRENPRMGRN
jgi:hypothetical protein